MNYWSESLDGSLPTDRYHECASHMVISYPVFILISPTTQDRLRLGHHASFRHGSYMPYTLITISPKGWCRTAPRYSITPTTPFTNITVVSSKPIFQNTNMGHFLPWCRGSLYYVLFSLNASWGVNEHWEITKDNDRHSNEELAAV